MPRYSTKIKPKQKPQQSMAPVWIVLAGFVVLFLAGWAFLSATSQTKANVEVKGAPRLKVEQDKIDHGDQKLGSSVMDTIRVTNVGDKPLSFTTAPYLEVKEGC